MYVEFTRFRLSSHHLKIETGRWARIQKEDRLCECGEVQDDLVVTCHNTNDIRERFGINNEMYQGIDDLMDKHPLLEIVDFIDKCTRRV